jgi:hypothetical protein
MDNVPRVVGAGVGAVLVVVAMYDMIVARGGIFKYQPAHAMNLRYVASI